MAARPTLSVLTLNQNAQNTTPSSFISCKKRERSSDSDDTVAALDNAENTTTSGSKSRKKQKTSSCSDEDIEAAASELRVMKEKYGKECVTKAYRKAITGRRERCQIKLDQPNYHIDVDDVEGNRFNWRAVFDDEGQDRFTNEWAPHKTEGTVVFDNKKKIFPACDGCKANKKTSCPIFEEPIPERQQHSQNKQITQPRRFQTSPAPNFSSGSVSYSPIYRQSPSIASYPTLPQSTPPHYTNIPANAIFPQPPFPAISSIAIHPPVNAAATAIANGEVLSSVASVPRGSLAPQDSSVHLLAQTDAGNSQYPYGAYSQFSYEQPTSGYVLIGSSNGSGQNTGLEDSVPHYGDQSFRGNEDQRNFEIVGGQTFNTGLERFGCSYGNQYFRGNEEQGNFGNGY